MVLACGRLKVAIKDWNRFSLILKVVLFIRKLKEILDGCPGCKGKYELVPISGDSENNKIADVLMGIHKAANMEVIEEDA